MSQSQVDPAGQLAFVAAASDDVRIVGREPVRGEPTTHYAATIDLQDAGGGTRTAALRANLAPLEPAIGDRRLTLDVWIDRAGRIRRDVVSIPLSSQASADGPDVPAPDAMMRIQGDFYAFGTAVRVAAPPPAQTRPYSALRSRVSTG